MSDVVGGGVKPPAEQSTAELIQNASEQISRLVRDELRLARAELTSKGRTAGIGVGLLGGGGIVALYGVAALLTALVLGLAEAMPAWAAALLVGVVLLAVAGVLALVGRGRVREAAPPVPEETVASVRRDIGAVASAVKERGEHR
ncbi:MAG TPA: phage holin family protein [Micromonosporaceae bacterium]|nr:phage holin family protein [Micromonosporaceae bacterium]